jgi:hypothetical protein
MCRVHTHRLSELDQADAIRDTRAQYLFGRSQPSRRPAGTLLVPRFSTDRGEKLESQALGRERCSEVRGAELGGEAPGEPARAVRTELDQAVETTGRDI